MPEFYSKSSYFEPYLLYSNDVVDRSLQARESMIQLIKHHLHKAQHRMKQLADKHRSERQSAIGVSFTVTKWGGITTREHAEVILCAGAIGSPQLLLLSGIGPRPYLSSWGIQVAHQMLAFRSILTPGQGGDLEVFRFDFKEERPGVNDLIEFPARGFKVQGKRIGDFNSERFQL